MTDREIRELLVSAEVQAPRERLADYQAAGSEVARHPAGELADRD
jgi:hypothetical protein